MNYSVQLPAAGHNNDDADGKICSKDKSYLMPVLFLLEVVNVPVTIDNEETLLHVLDNGTLLDEPSRLTRFSGLFVIMLLPNKMICSTPLSATKKTETLHRFGWWESLNEPDVSEGGRDKEAYDTPQPLF
jgi:hypothetical protein